ncbi:hypothetical protein [Novosphingobium sp. MBES04]|uniref:hypothetical protein n=1 Tax=Novosphingobium sp. MBES04 TaxID=1206458 RepID=UPI0005801AAE|nr:hypothetical protein [Novosphingobium sp. MBES04]GAM06359.1 hypothetical conserved protein [Novosphingobium sp. MBES04]
MLTHYKSSKGPVEIATMPLRYAKNARDKLVRGEPERAEEIDVLTAHIEKLEAAAEASEGTTTQSVAQIGDNGGPAIEEIDAGPGAWNAVQADLDDLLEEAANWADGAEITNDAQADEVGKLRGMLQQSTAYADQLRQTEKKPFDEKVAEIQDRYNAYIAPMKNRNPGKASKAIFALNNVLTVWLNKKEAERRVREREVAAAAAKAAQEALAAREEAKTSTDLGEIDRADTMLSDAEALIREAKGFSKEKVRAGGGEGLRAVGLRSTWHAEITDRKAALLHYLAQQPEAFHALLQELADKDARNEATRRTIPGVAFIETKKAA